jgi:putative PIN family toxin of toxin-antitoxin system
MGSTFYVSLQNDVTYAIIPTMSQKIVVDTSVLISALIGKRGASREVLRRCLKGEYDPQISNALFQEYEAVNSRREVIERCPLTEREIRELLNAIYSVCTWTPVYYLWRPNLRDEGDNFLIELALAGNSEVIVTNNVKDLENAELNFEGLRILRPEQLLRGK